MMRRYYILGLSALLLNGCGNNQSTSPPATPPPSANSAAVAKPQSTPETTGAAANTAQAVKQQVAPAESGYLSGLANAKSQAVGTVDVASLTQAISMFNVDEGRYPKSLQELADKKYIGQVPPAPYGKKLNYDAATGVVKVVDQ